MTTRTRRDEQLALAREELASFADVVDAGWQPEIHAYAVVGEALARQLVTRARGGHHVVVADKISEPARRLLERRGWSWVDRRIGAHVAGDGRDIEVRYRDRVDPRPASTAGSAIRGRAGLAYAAALVCDPTAPPSFRRVAATAGMSPQSISNAVRLLADAGLVGPDLRPTLPDLFWQLADAWEPSALAPVAAVPPPTDGWVLGGDAAAAELGAPVVSLDDRPWVWVPAAVDVRRAERALGHSSWDDRAAVVAVAPTPLLLSTAMPGTSWALPHPALAALELARDRGRGREILEHWEPDGVDVVWR